RVLRGMRRDAAERDAVVPAYRPHDLSAREPIRAGLLHPRIHLPRDGIDACRVAPGRLPEGRLRQHGDPGFVWLPGLEIPQVDLPACAQDRRRAARGPSTVA